MPRLLVINKCRDCKHRHHNWRYYICGKIDGADLPVDGSIPRWCPLPQTKRKTN